MGLGQLGITAIKPEEYKFLVGIGIDGASANIASGGMKGLVEKELPWIYWMWCLAHRLELAVHPLYPITMHLGIVLKCHPTNI